MKDVYCTIILRENKDSLKSLNVHILYAVKFKSIVDGIYVGSNASKFSNTFCHSEVLTQILKP